MIWASAEVTTALLQRLIDQPLGVHDFDRDILPPSGLSDVHVVALYERTHSLQADFGTEQRAVAST